MENTDTDDTGPESVDPWAARPGPEFIAALRRIANRGGEMRDLVTLTGLPRTVLLQLLLSNVVPGAVPQPVIDKIIAKGTDVAEGN